jgi:opacity protein-like surface antigen
VSALVVCAAILALCFPADVPAQGISSNSFLNWNFIGSGARARAMGGAFLGVSNDGSAGTWNPAGLIFNEGVLLTANYGYSRVDFGLDNTPVSPMSLPTNDVSFNDNLSSLNSANLVAPLTIREHEFFLSAYYHRVQDVYTQGRFFVDDIDTTQERRLKGLTDILGTPFSADFNLSGNIAYIGAGFGTSITSNLSIGANLNIITGDGTEIHNMLLDSSRFSKANTNPLVSPNDSILWFDRSEIDYSGLNFTLGAMYTADRWAASLVFTPGWTLTQNLDYLGIKTKINKSRPIGSLTPGLIPGPDGTDRKITIPYTIGLGGAYNVNENLLVAADYQFRAFKREGEIDYESDPVTPDSPLETMRNAWFNLHQLRLGAEYLLETNWGIVPVRVGVRNDPLLISDQENVVVVFEQRAGYRNKEKNPARFKDFTPRDDYFLPLTRSGATGDQINPVTFTFGSGIHWSQVHLDFAVEVTGYKYEEAGRLELIRLCDLGSPSDQCPANDPKAFVDDWGKRAKDEFGAFTRTYEDNRVRFSLNFTGYF